MFKITSNLETLCLDCGEDLDGVIVGLEDRADLEGEICYQCQREIA